MRELLDYLPLLIMPASGLIILLVVAVLVHRDKVDRKRHHPAE